MTASFQAQHIIPGDKVYLGGEERTVTMVVHDVPTTTIVVDGYASLMSPSYELPNGQLVTVTEAAQRPAHA